jgi:hypothetical protein
MSIEPGLPAPVAGRHPWLPNLFRIRYSVLPELCFAVNRIDEGGFRKEETGKIAYAYAHPVFRAPFSLVGEGRQR